MIQTLNYNWKYKKGFDDSAIKGNMEQAELIHIPHTNVVLPFNYINEKDYQIQSTYQLRFDAKERLNKNFIEFEGVAHYAKVYLNGQYLGEHKGGYTAFKFDISEILVDENNLLTVFVDSSEDLNIPPFGKVIDYLTYGGIYREVNLISKNDVFIDDVYTYGLDLLNNPKVGLDIRVNELKKDLTVDLEWLFKGELVKKITDSKISKEEEKLIVDFSDIKLWSLETPNLYELKVTLKDKTNILDVYSVKTGYREAIFKNDGFFLNGKHIDIIGLNRHQSYPYVGYAMPKSAQVKDALILKNELGVNLSRASHYPQSKHFLNACDEIGLLVFEEIPGWQNVGDLEWQDVAVKNVEEMVLEHRNHPSIIIWGVRINESLDNHEFYKRTNEVARRLDPHRQTGGVRNIEMVKPDKNAWLEDVYTYNDFDYRLGHPLTDVKDVFPVSGIPGIVTEHSGHTFPTKSFDNEERRQIHALRHTNIINRMKGDKQIGGVIGWCAFDYNTHVEFGSGDRICYHGVMDIFRNSKLAASAYASQGLKTPYLNVSSNMNIGEHDRAVINDVYIFTNCDYVSMYRNDKFISKMYPNKEEFPNLEHSPMLIDWFGDVLETIEGYSKEEAKRIKTIHRAINKYGIQAVPEDIKALTKDSKELDHILDLHNKHIQNWSGKVVSYRFEGFINDKMVVAQNIGGEYEARLSVKADSNELVNGDTYDVTRITVEMLNENNNRLIYSNEAFEIITDELVELIGDRIVSLVGGVRSFWIKSKPNVKGTSKVRIKNKNQEFVVIIDVK